MPAGSVSADAIGQPASLVLHEHVDLAERYQDVTETQTEIAVLSVGEAVMRMDLADQAVMMFRNSASGVLNVVYRRNDGHIGWIDPGT